MDKDVKANVNSASLIDLKAELFRKHEEFKQQKSASGSFVKGRIQEKSKPDLFSRKNKGVLERAQKDYEEKVEEEDVHAKSRRALEAKTKLYEKMSSSSEIPEEDEVYLVDFQKKVIDRMVEARDRDRSDERQPIPARQDEEEVLSKDIPPPSDPQEEWIDYVDTLGRSRRCMKKDLPQLVKQDKEMARVRGEVKTSVEHDSEEGPSLMSSDMHREMLRQKWEKEEMEALNNKNIHYSNVQFDENRTHGVGFYQFDKSDEKRQEQMDTLNKLRDQTVDERSRRERLKEKRKAMMDARLAKVKQRRKLKDGSTFTENQGEEEEIGPKLEEMLTGKRTEEEKKETTQKKGAEPLTRDDSWRKNAPVREWDEGKKETGLFSQERYMSKRREEREAEFAPPVAYFDSASVQRTSQNKTGSNTTLGKAVFSSRQEASKSEAMTLTHEEVDVGSIPLPTDTKQERKDIVMDSKPNIPPSNMSHPEYQSTPFIPLPNFSLPPPGYQQAQWVTTSSNTSTSSVTGYSMYPGKNVTPTSVFTPPLPDMSVPPPGISFIPPTAQATELYVGHPPQAAYPSVQPQTSQTPSTSGVYESKPTVYVPRASVLDTRLVQNVDSDIPSSDNGPEVQAEPYKPGSFTAALQAEHQAKEDVASASRDKAHFKGGPVIYHHESVTEVKTETDNSGKSSTDVPSEETTEDEVSAFLKEIRESA